MGRDGRLSRKTDEGRLLSLTWMGLLQSAEAWKEPERWSCRSKTEFLLPARLQTGTAELPAFGPEMKPQLFRGLKPAGLPAETVPSGFLHFRPSDLDWKEAIGSLGFLAL